MATMQKKMTKTESLSHQFKTAKTTPWIWDRVKFINLQFEWADKEGGGDFMRDEADHATKDAFELLHNHLAPQYFKDPASAEIDPIAFANWAIDRLKTLQPRTYDKRITGFAELLEKERDWIASGGTKQIRRYSINQMPYVSVLGLQYG